MFTPAVWVQMRRYGRISPARMLGTAALVVYAVGLIAYTLLPLPSGDLVQWCAKNAVPGVQLNPLQFIDDIRTDTAGLGLKATLTHTTTLQVVLNVVLFVPLGFLARRFLGFGVALSALAGLASSLLIDATQYTGVYGLVPCSYRVADVDPHVWTFSEWLLQYPVPLLVVFTVPAWVGSGASLGQRAVWLHPVRPDGTAAGLGRRVARAWTTGGLWLTLLALAALPRTTDWFDLGAVVVAVTAVLAAVPSSHRGLSAAMTGLRFVDSRTADSNAAPKR